MAHPRRLTEQQIAEIRRIYQEGSTSQRELAAQLSVSQGVIHRAVAGVRQPVGEGPWYTVRQAAAYLGLKPGSIYQYLSSGRLAGQFAGGQRVIFRKELDAYVRRTPSFQTQQRQEPPIFAHFALARFCADLEQACHARGRSWQQVKTATGVSQQLSVLRECTNLTLSTLVPLAVWAGLSLDTYVVNEDETDVTIQHKEESDA